MLSDAKENKINRLNKIISNDSLIYDNLKKEIVNKDLSLQNKDSKIRWIKIERGVLFIAVILLTGKLIL